MENKVIDIKEYSDKITLFQDNDWDKLVQTVYGKPYCFQQQDGCKERGLHFFTVTDNGVDYLEDYENDSLPEEVNHEEMGVSFKAWLERDPEQLIQCKYNPDRGTQMWWERNFYPEVGTIIDDLFKRGILPQGEYGINIDW